jgi:hypothetical protein
MNPREYYKRMAANITDADIRMVAALMTDYIGEDNAVKLDDLCRRSGFGERQVRAMLETITTVYGIPIGSHSGRAGRWIIADEAERMGVIAELVSRRNALDDRIRAVREARLPVKLPLDLQEAQAELFGEPVSGCVNPLGRW